LISTYLLAAGGLAVRRRLSARLYTWGKS